MDIRQVGDGVRIIDISGEITSFSEKEIASTHEKAGDGATAVILNFTDLEYMNSGGIGLLVTLLVRAQRANRREFLRAGGWGVGAGTNERWRGGGQVLPELRSYS